jgi:hypothetical protein
MKTEPASMWLLPSIVSLLKRHLCDSSPLLSPCWRDLYGTPPLHCLLAEETSKAAVKLVASVQALRGKLLNGTRESNLQVFVWLWCIKSHSHAVSCSGNEVSSGSAQRNASWTVRVIGFVWGARSIWLAVWLVEERERQTQGVERGRKRTKINKNRKQIYRSK